VLPLPEAPAELDALYAAFDPEMLTVHDLDSPRGHALFEALGVPDEDEFRGGNFCIAVHKVDGRWACLGIDSEVSFYAVEEPSSLGKLQALIASGQLHHATYRNRGTVWEGIWVYRKAADGFRGYEVETGILKSDPDYERAYEVLQGKGLHVGAYGGG
jgi:hypothetical protein